MRTLLILAAMPLMLGACQSKLEREGAGPTGGPPATRSYGVADFTGVDLRGSDDVEVHVGSGFAVTAEGDSLVLDRLDIRVVDGDLRIARKGNSWSIGGDKGVRIRVTMPRLTSASVAGSGNLTVDQAEGDFDGAVSGSGNLNVATLKGGKADLAVSGSGDLTIGGTATMLDASIAGSGDIDARRLSATGADISIAGSGNIAGTVKGAAAVSIVGSGDVELTGGAKCSISKMGSGDARCS